MIFILHYFLYNAGLSATIILLTLFLQTYTQASMSEIGALLMILPFLSIVVKPVFCALADRQQAHKSYLMGSLLVMALGFGSLAIAPFYPHFIEQHGRLVWYLDVLAIVIGHSAFGIVWSLGDALAVNAARVQGVPWGAFRVWGTVSWGLFGWLIGQINETPLLPKYVPAFFVLVGSLLLEVVLLALWPSRHFVMAESQQLEGHQQVCELEGHQEAVEKRSEDSSDERRDEPGELAAVEAAEAHWPANRSLSGTLSGSTRMNPRLVGAMANIFMEDIGDTLKSSLRLGGQPKRHGLAELLDQQQLAGPLPATPLAATTPVPPSPINQSFNSLANGSQTGGPPSSGAATLSKLALRRAQMALSRMNSLSSASGTVIAEELRRSEQTAPASAVSSNSKQQAILLSSLGRATAQRALAASNPKERPLSVASLGPVSEKLKAHSLERIVEEGKGNQAAAQRSAESLQLILLKLIVQRNRPIVKYLVLFTLLGFFMFVHITYFFLHVEQICRDKALDFSSVTGYVFVTHAVSETFAFLVLVPYYMPRVGRFGSILTCLLLFAARFAFYGTYFAQLSPYMTILTEAAHGFVYGITYSLITDIATECVDQVDEYLPELVERQLVPASMQPDELKLPLRATMIGVFSGAFDGLGTGAGALFGGIFLDYSSYASLWLFCAYVLLATATLYPLLEWHSARRSSTTKRPPAADLLPATV